MTVLIPLAGWLIVSLILFLFLLAVGHIAYFFSRPRPQPRGFEVVPRSRGEGDA
jgi:hypothetical protein